MPLIIYYLLLVSKHVIRDTLENVDHLAVKSNAPNSNDLIQVVVTYVYCNVYFFCMVKDFKTIATT